MNWKTILAAGAILFSGTICAQPPLLGSPDITLSGGDFVEISGYFDGPSGTGDEADEGQEGCTWYSQDNAIFTLWDHGGPANHYGHCFWVLYVVELDTGYWRAGVDAINVGAGIKDQEWYPRFEVLTELEGVSLGHLDTAVVYIPASDDEINRGFQWFYIPEDGLYGVKFTWLNDKSGEGYDVNIMIDSVFFDKWPPGHK